MVFREFTVYGRMVPDNCVLGEVSMNSQRFVSIRIKLLSLLFYLHSRFRFWYTGFFSYEYIKNVTGRGSSSLRRPIRCAPPEQYFRLREAGGLYGARLYFNSEVMDILSEKEQSVSSYRLLQTESRIFDFLQTLYSSVPDASQIQLSAFNLKKVPAAPVRYAAV